MKIKILLVEDDTNLGFVISDQLRTDGYQVTLCTDGAEGFKKFNEETFLTAKSMTEDKVEGFKSGGDDYLTKPFSTEELQLRISALLKRVNIAADVPDESSIKLGDYIFDTLNFKLKHANFEKTLTKKEAQILKILCKFKNQVVARDIVLNAVWGQDDYFVGRSLDVFITKLRKYFKEDSTITITNIHGIGFKLEVAE